MEKGGRSKADPNIQTIQSKDGMIQQLHEFHPHKASMDVE